MRKKRAGEIRATAPDGKVPLLGMPFAYVNGEGEVDRRHIEVQRGFLKRRGAKQLVASLIKRELGRRDEAHLSGADVVVSFFPYEPEEPLVYFSGELEQEGILAQLDKALLWTKPGSTSN